MKSPLASHWLPCPVCFISAAHQGRRDIMTGTAMFISEEDNLLIVSLSPGHLTEQLIEEAGEFSLALAADDQKDLALRLGSADGFKADKYRSLALETLSPQPGKPEVPTGVSAWWDCRVVKREVDRGQAVFTAHARDHQHFGRSPLIWQKGLFFGLQPIANPMPAD